MKLIILFAVILISASASDDVTKDFAYQVQILQRMNSNSPYEWCGGSLLSHEWVLTAAACVFGHESVVVYLGSTDPSQGQKEYTVDKKDFIVETWFNTHPIQNDIALIKIPYTNYTENIRNIRLPAIDKHYSSYFGDEVIASVKGQESEIGSKATDLKWGRFIVNWNEKCNKYYTNYTLPPSNICIDFNGSISPCQVYFGSPLVLEDSNIQIGLQSFLSNGGCKKTAPAAFTCVTYYLDWIRDNTGISY